MNVYRMVCVENYMLADCFGTIMRLRRGKVYAVSRPRNGMVTVHGKVMVKAPARLFQPSMFASNKERRTQNRMTLRQFYAGAVA